MRTRWWILLGVVTIAAVIAAMTLTPLQEGFASWSGGMAPVQIIASTVTPIGAMVAVVGLIINGRAANKTLEHSIQAERAARFQKACELSASGNTVSKSGGQFLMSKLAVEAPEDYLFVVLNTLDSIIMEGDVETRRTCGYFDYPKTRSDPPPRSSSVSSDVLEAVSRVQKQVPNWKAVYAKEGATEVNLNCLFISAIMMTDLQLEALYLNKFVFGRLIFEKIKFGNSVFDGLIYGLAEFVECDLRNSTFIVIGPDLQPLTPHDNLLVLRDCKTEGTTINGHSYDDWMKLPQAQPEPVSTQSQPAA
jgi:uncharacterized membrane protein